MSPAAPIRPTGAPAAAARVGAMAVALGVLAGAAHLVLRAPCWSLFLLALPLAWPIWHGQREYLLLERRAVLAGALVDASRVRRWLWAGHVHAVLQVFAALFWAMVLLAFAPLLDRSHWIVLAVDVVLLALLVGPVRRRLETDVRSEHVDAVARRWPLAWLNLAILAAAFVALDFFVLGAPDTRGLTWPAVFDRAWGDVQAVAACPLAGAMVGFVAAVQSLAWHAAEVLIPALPRGELKYAAWAFFLLQAGLLAYGVTRLVLGASALAQHAIDRERSAGSPFARAFWVTMLVLGAAWLYGAWRAQDFDAAAMKRHARVAVDWANPCQPDAAVLRDIASGHSAQVARARDEARLRADAQVAARLDPLFAEAEQGIDRYLDWYFTVLSEYERLGALAAGNLETMMRDALERHLFGDGMLGERIEMASVAIARESEAAMGKVALGVGSGMQAQARARPCELAAIDLPESAALQRDVLRVSSAVGGGALVGGLAVRQIGRRMVAAAATRAASKHTFRVAASLGGKTATKRAGSIALSAAGAAALCAPGGPLALLCGLGAAVVSWIAFDHALVRIDEALFRDAMREEIVAALREQKAELAGMLRTQHHEAIDRMAAEIEAGIQRTFIPARDGV